MYVANGNLIVPVQKELSIDAITKLKRDIVQYAHAKSVKSVIINLEELDVINSFFAKELSLVSETLKLLGIINCFSGLKPYVVASLVTRNLFFDNQNVAANIDQAETLMLKLNSK